MVTTAQDQFGDNAPAGTEPLLVVSCDCHAGPEHMSAYREYIDPSLRSAYDDYLAAIDVYDAARLADISNTVTEGYEKYARKGGGAPLRAGHDGLWDGTTRNKDLTADGVAAEVIFPQGSAPFAPYPALAAAVVPMVYTIPPEHRNAGAHAYNRWLADTCAEDPARHLGVAVLPIRDVDKAVREVEWAANAGLNGGVSLPPPIPGEFPYYHDAIYEPLWAACATNNMTINMHGGAGNHYGVGPVSYAINFAETDWFSHRALWFLIFSGVFERHPNLHTVITEQRIHWTLPLLADLDSQYEAPRLCELRKIIPKRPSEYFAQNCYLGASFISKLEVEQREEIGVDRILWGTDYPHIEGTWPWTSESMRWSFEGVSEQELRLMLGFNAIECYHLDRTYLEQIAGKIGPRVPEVQDRLEAIPSDEGAELCWAFRTRGAWS